jgi:diaminopimelate epimerase
MAGKTLAFTKMHGLGNDFIVIDGALVPQAEYARQKKLVTPEFARKICDRRFGVGADQILWIKPARSKSATAEMHVINADGSVAEMCGNGIRAVALYLDQRLPKSKRPSGSKKIYPIQTGAGLLHVEVEGSFARVNMGEPEFSKKPKTLSLPKLSTKISYWNVSMGNPHAVIFVEDPWDHPVEERGAVIEKLPEFPRRTNVEFVRAEDRHTLVCRVWERGVGLTLACGTGACAAAVASILEGSCESPVQVKLPGGELKIEWSLGSPVFMSGPAEEVFSGLWKL